MYNSTKYFNFANFSWWRNQLSFCSARRWLFRSDWCRYFREWRCHSQSIQVQCLCKIKTDRNFVISITFFLVYICRSYWSTSLAEQSSSSFLSCPSFCFTPFCAISICTEWRREKRKSVKWSPLFQRGVYPSPIILKLRIRFGFGNTQSSSL